MEVYPKFIIETDEQDGDCLIISKCTYHRQLVTINEKVKGGGWWTLDRDNKIFTLFGQSEEFGRAKIEDIADCVQRKKVFSNAALVDNLTHEYKFRYKNEVGELTDLETFSI
jgi:hypothetical protein